MRQRLISASLALALCAAMGTLGSAGASAPSSCGLTAPSKVFTGAFGREMQGSYVLVPFQVPSLMTKVRVKLCYDQAESSFSGQLKHTLDLGLYQPSSDGFFDREEFRGWGGSSRLDAFVSPDAATLGFKPGAIPAGTWAAEIGVAAIVAQTEGDLDGKVSWRLEVLNTADPTDADNPWTPTPYNTTAASAEKRWYKGDFHVHAEHSNPSDATMRRTFDYAFGPRPTGAGLDFITLSDYVTDRHWDEIGRYQADYPGKLVIRSAEVITYRGHINNHASLKWADYRTGPLYSYDGSNLTLLREARPPSTIFDTIHSGGGWTQINHPTTFPGKVPVFDKLCRGCSWEYSDAETDWSKVDAFEVQTGPSGYTDPKGNEPGPNPFGPPGIEWWDRLRLSGYRITAVGSSDSHKADEENLTTSPIGEATTAVFADGLSESSIRAAVLAGHAYVKFFSSDGPDLRFNASPAGGGPDAMMGDILNASSAQFTARVIGGAPSPQPRTLLVIKDHVVIASVPVTTNDFTFTFPGVVGGDYRLQLERGSATEALTNPITLITS